MFGFKNTTYLRLLYQIINAYTRRLPFPSRGSSLLWSLLKRTGLYHQAFTKKIFNGALMQVRPDDHIQRQLLWHGIYEKEASLFTQLLLQPGDNMIDIGANTGYYSLIAAKKIQQGRVIAFEPIPALRILIQEQALLNRFENITIAPYALSDRTGAATFYIAASDNTGMSGLQEPGNFSGEKIEVALTTLDDWLSQHPLSTIKLIKIDTEGAEYQVLKGMQQTLLTFKPVILIELMNELMAPFNSRAEQVYDLFSSLGYKGYELAKENRLAPAKHGQTAYNLVFLPENFVLPPAIKR